MKKLPGGEGGGFLDGEAGPSESFAIARGQVFDFDRGAHDADEVHRVTVLLGPRNLSGPRVLHLGLIVIVIIIHRAFQP